MSSTASNPAPSSPRHKRVAVARAPKFHDEPHDETFWELFYDVILVVVFIKLSYVKYELNASGLATVGGLFANFWSCWSLLNIYVTMLHGNDLLHRAYYSFHIARTGAEVGTTQHGPRAACTFFMALYLGHANWAFFNFKEQAYYISIVSIAPRSVIRLGMILMWLYTMALSPAGHAMRHVARQIGIKLFAISASVCLFSVAASFYDDPKTLDDDCLRRRLAGGDDDPCDFYDSHVEPKYNKTIILWFLAVFVEQVGCIFGCFYGRLPFAAEYAGERTQSWMMLAFGESIIGILAEDLSYDNVILKFRALSFFVVLALCFLHYDITHAGTLLPVLIARGERAHAAAYMFLQGPYSFVVFLVGVGLKSLTASFAPSRVDYMELARDTGCPSHATATRNDLWRRRLDGRGGARRPGAARRLADEDLDVYKVQDRIRDSFWLTYVSIAIVITWCSLVAYLAPSPVPRLRRHVGRVGAVFVGVMPIYVQSRAKTIKTDCFRAAAAADGDDFDGAAHDDDEKGYSTFSLVEEVYLCNILALTAVAVAFLAFDFDRDATFHALLHGSDHGEERAPPDSEASPEATSPEAGGARRRKQAGAVEMTDVTAQV
ncbi:hypothetical protein M885DRAFT_616638 [Pelagophyceae sp. CCMP2097]|nr:hypothetical protein M885DRAFT_616638 [Pelagophyceae sp. CCMP2097]